MTMEKIKPLILDNSEILEIFLQKSNKDIQL